MKKILFLLTISVLFLSSCSDFLDSQNFTKQTTANFPKNVTDAEQMITGVYNSLNEEIQSDYTSSPYFITELASDERFGGGGENDRAWQAVDKLMNYGVNMFGGFWNRRYQGIFRVNQALETFDNVAWESEAQKNQYFGELYFMRGYFYFTLVQFYENVPLVLETKPVNLPQATPAEVYGQAASDLKKAIELLPSASYSATVPGHASKWAAESFMARMFLFYTGYYGQTELPLAEGGSISKAQVTGWLEDCIANSGHALVPDYRNIWAYSNEYTGQDYEYSKENNLKWVGDGSIETIFATKFGNTTARNTLCQAFGLRQPLGQANSFPFGQGWGGGPINPTLWEEWEKAEPNDIRREGSIFYGDDLAEYRWGADNQVEESGYWQKKYVGITCFVGGEFKFSYSIPMYGYSGSWSSSYTNDLIHMRFADVLLMHSELKGDAQGLNQVRARSGLKPVSGYSLEAIKQERRFELCFENSRFNDLRRWGDAAEVLGRQEGVKIRNKNVETTMKRFGAGYKARYEATGGFWPIPEDQIKLADGILVQNKGWGSQDVEYSGW